VLFSVSTCPLLPCYQLIETFADGLPPLTQRQERRNRQPSIITHGTMDSWDFSLTASPTNSVPTRPGQLRKTSFASVRKSTDSSSSTPGPEGVFEFEAEVDVTVDSVNEDDEQQMEPFVSDPPSPPELSPSPSSSSMSSPSPSGATMSAGTSVPDAALISSKDPTMSTIVASTSLPVPVPFHPDSVETHLRPPGPSEPSSLPLPTSAPLPSTSAPPNLPQTSSSPSIWRMLTRNASGTVKAEDQTKGKKGFLSRKASNALMRTKSKTACECPDCFCR
jgi:serine/threonine-protein kinase OSR1/STK39